ncbi:MAG: molybdenum cofactor synthesis domain-containing protein [Litorimonas sp.]
MIGVDENLIFRPLNIAVLTVSDTRTKLNDRSGDSLAERAKVAGHSVTAREIVKDDILEISNQIDMWVSDKDIDVILTTGGTGLTGRDVTIEAIKPLFRKTLEGFSILFHRLSVEKVGLTTLQSRACAGVIGVTFVFCLPGSTRAVGQVWDEIIAGALDSRYRPSSLVDLIPRLSE